MKVTWDNFDDVMYEYLNYLVDNNKTEMDSILFAMLKDKYKNIGYATQYDNTYIVTVEIKNETFMIIYNKTDSNSFYDFDYTIQNIYRLD